MKTDSTGREMVLIPAIDADSANAGGELMPGDELIMVGGKSVVEGGARAILTALGEAKAAGSVECEVRRKK